MPYVIDAYNVIFADEELDRIADGKLERGRDALLALLGPLAAAGKTVVAVFDGAEVAFPGSRRTSRHGVRVIFSEPKGTADIEIERVIESAPPGANWRVVTNDRKLARRARSLGAKAIPVREFLAKMRQEPPRRRGDPEISPGEVDYWLRVFGLDE